MKSNAFLSSLFVEYSRDLKRFITRKFGSSDAEDIVQDAFHNILRCDNLEELENPKAYLFQTAQNLALNRIRKKNNHNDYILTQDHDAAEVSLEVSVTAKTDLERVQKAIKKLPVRCQQAFSMSRLQGKTYAEIAEALDVSPSTVEKYVAKSLLFLRDHLD